MAALPSYEVLYGSQTVADGTSYGTGVVIVTGLATVDFFTVEPSTFRNAANAGVSPDNRSFQLTVVRNSPVAGSVTVKVRKVIYDLAQTVTGVTGLPSGASERTTSGGQTRTTGSATGDHGGHTIASHNHGGTATISFEAPAEQTLSALLLAALGPTDRTVHQPHTHGVTAVTSVGGNVSTAATHGHTWNRIYTHTHSAATSTTTVVSTELAAGDKISGTLVWLAVGS